MACNGLISETPATIASRLYKLILSFPSAATGGVEWKVLARTYNRLHSTQLDIAALGHSSPLVAAHALLGDALRLVDKNEANPVVAIEDWVAMTVQPGAPATWPSLYKSLCEIVCEHGSEESTGHGTSFVMLVSQLKPRLVRHGRGDFDETSWSYITNQGKHVRVKKMKHLLQALVGWREEHIAWRAEGRPKGCSELDQVLTPRLELSVSKEYHDKLFRCLLPTLSTASDRISSSPEIGLLPRRAVSMPCLGDATAQSDEAVPCHSPCGSYQQGASPYHNLPRVRAVPRPPCNSSGSAELFDEISMLRAENAKLRSRNSALAQLTNQELQQELAIEVTTQSETLAQNLTIDVWDSPSEPPPFEYYGSIEVTPLGSTAVLSEFGFCSGNATPNTMASSCHSQTGPAAPTTQWSARLNATHVVHEW